MEKSVFDVTESDLNELRVEVDKELVCQELDGEMVLLDMVTVKLPPSVKTRWDVFHYAENQNGGMHGTTNQLAAAYR